MKLEPLLIKTSKIFSRGFRAHYQSDWIGWNSMGGMDHMHGRNPLGREAHGHGCAFLHLRGRADLALVRFDDRAGDRQAEAAARRASGTRGVSAVKTLEDMRKFITRNPASVIGHQEHDAAVFAHERDLHFVARAIVLNGV